MVLGIRRCDQFGGPLQAFPHVTVAPTARLGYQFLMTCSGLGGLDVNTVVIPLLRGLSRSASGSSINNLFAASNVSAGPATSSFGHSLTVNDPTDRLADAGADPDDDVKSLGGRSLGGRSLGGKSMVSNTTTGSNIVVPVKDAGTCKREQFSLWGVAVVAVCTGS